MSLPPFAPIVKRFVGLLVVGFAERAACPSVGSLETGTDDVEPAAVDVHLGEALLGVDETARRLPHAERRALAVRRNDALAQTADEAPAAEAGGALELIHRLQQHVPVALSRYSDA